jgi:hypothetical protein
VPKEQENNKANREEVDNNKVKLERAIRQQQGEIKTKGNM